MKTTLLALMLTLVPTLTGCLIAPVPAFGRKTVDGTRIQKEDVAFLQPGRTTREELVKRFGEPWAHYRDVEVMVYYWDVRKGYWVWGIIIPEAVAAGGAEDITSLEYLFVKLDESDRVQKYDFIKHARNVKTRDQAIQWAQKNAP